MAHLWLIGMMGTGKSAVGRLLAERRGVCFYDLDEVIESATGKTIPELFDSRGERGFRAIEADTLREIAGVEPGVVATGGGAVLREVNVETMRASGTTVLLRAAPAELTARLAGSADRPLLAVPDQFLRIAELLEIRAQAYERAADVTVDTDGLDVERIAELIEDQCGT